jgi:hypothetical protein
MRCSDIKNMNGVVVVALVGSRILQFDSRVYLLLMGKICS